jgi:hypothetical protein
VLKYEQKIAPFTFYLNTSTAFLTENKVSCEMNLIRRGEKGRSKFSVRDLTQHLSTHKTVMDHWATQHPAMCRHYAPSKVVSNRNEGFILMNWKVSNDIICMYRCSYVKFLVLSAVSER